MSYGINVQNLEISGAPVDKQNLVYDSGIGGIKYADVDATKIAGNDVASGSPADGDSLVWDAGLSHFAITSVVAQGGFRWQGLWSDVTNYALNDLVLFNGLEYIANAGNTNSAPTSGSAVGAIGTFVNSVSNTPVFSIICQKAGAAGNSVQCRMATAPSIVWYKSKGLVIWKGMDIAPWQPNTPYGGGDVVLDSNGRVQINQTPNLNFSGTATPNWSTDATEIGSFQSTASDGSISWMCAGYLPTNDDEVTVLMAGGTFNAAPSSPTFTLSYITKYFTPDGSNPGFNVLGWRIPTSASGGELHFNGYFSGFGGASDNGVVNAQTIDSGIGGNYAVFTGGADANANPDWTLFTVTGATGPQGLTGPTGPAGATVDAVGSVYVASGAIAEKTGLVIISGSGIAMSIDAPTAGTDDGKRLRIMNDSTNGNTVALSSGNWNNDSTFAKTTLTFGTTWKDAFVEIEAYNGAWFITDNPTLNAGTNYSVTLS